MGKTSLRALLVLGLLPTLSMSHGVEIVAHRGASAQAPENTVAAAKLAWEQQSDWVELDIYLTKDQRIITIHDATTKRTTGVEGVVEEMTLEELQKLDAGSYKGPSYAGEKPPALEEMIATMPEGKGLFIEIKKGPAIVPVLKDILVASGKPLKEFAIISFNFDSAKAAKAALPECKVLWLVSHDPKKYTLEGIIQQCKEGNLDGLDLHYAWPITPDFVKQIKDQNLLLYTWTVDDLGIARNQVASGVDGITTNRPGWLRQNLNP